MTTKIVIYPHYGGFEISRRCAELMAASGHAAAKELLKDYPVPKAVEWWEEAEPDPWCGFIECSRHDPVLIKAVEALEQKASTDPDRMLAIIEIEGSVYRVCEYDGSEWLETPETIAWVTVDGSEE